MPRITSKWTVEIDAELRAFFIVWQKAFDVKLDQINVDPKGKYF
jgi:hypothetical protein